MVCRIVYDLDGVLRDLVGIIQRKYSLPTPVHYNQWNQNGNDIYSLVAKDYSVLVKAQPTSYLKVLQDYLQDIEIWSYQPDDWIVFTGFWINQYLKNKNISIKYYTPEEKFKQLQKNKNILLIEDYPLFPDYERVILIDRSYNQEVKAKVRIKSPSELITIIKEVCDDAYVGEATGVEGYSRIS